ncbi:MAG: FAD-binding oxidoreductase [Acidobacteria bacterium]|nr:FAD-binding oxidoreductase [Acidobacteriota bacterium]
METADVLIIGGGIVGVTTAFHLAKAGAGKVILCERNAIGSGTSSLSGAMCGQQAEINDTISALAIRARQIYENFDELIGGDCGFYNRGILEQETTMERAEKRAAAARRNGAVSKALNLEETQRVYPELSSEGIGATIFYPGTGCVDSYRTLQAYARGARRLGVDLREFTPIKKLVAKKGRITTVLASKGAISPHRVVLACGPWSPQVTEEC